jgi:hypothetical protein
MAIWSGEMPKIIYKYRPEKEQQVVEYITMVRKLAAEYDAFCINLV